MQHFLRLLTPPEWDGWHLLAKIAYLTIFWGLMIPVIMFARWFSGILIP